MRGVAGVCSDAVSAAAAPTAAGWAYTDTDTGHGWLRDGSRNSRRRASGCAAAATPCAPTPPAAQRWHAALPAARPRSSCPASPDAPLPGRPWPCGTANAWAGTSASQAGASQHQRRCRPPSYTSLEHAGKREQRLLPAAGHVACVLVLWAGRAARIRCRAACAARTTCGHGRHTPAARQARHPPTLRRLSSGVDSQAATRTSTRGSHSASMAPAHSRAGSAACAAGGSRGGSAAGAAAPQRLRAPGACTPGTPSAAGPTTFATAASCARRSQVAFSSAGLANRGASTAARSSRRCSGT